MVFLTKAPSLQNNHVSFRPNYINYECIMAVVDIDLYKSLKLYDMFEE